MQTEYGSSSFPVSFPSTVTGTTTTISKRHH